jgi:hypothetical protein
MCFRVQTTVEFLSCHVFGGGGGWLLGSIVPQESLHRHIYRCFSLVEVKLYSFLAPVVGSEWSVPGCCCLRVFSYKELSMPENRSEHMKKGIPKLLP